MKRFITGMLCMAALLILACGAVAETVYLTDMGIETDEAVAKVATIGNLTKGERLIDPDELALVAGTEGLYSLALTEAESGAYRSVKYGNFSYSGLDRTQDLYAVRIQSQGIQPGSIGIVNMDSSALYFSEDAPNAGDLDFYAACPESFLFTMIGAIGTDASYARRQVGYGQVDLSAIAVGETLTVKQTEVINGFKPYALQFTKVALLREAVPSSAEALVEEPFTLYFTDIGLAPESIRITTTGYRGEISQMDFHARTLAREEYAIEADAPEGVVAITFSPQVFEADGYRYGNHAMTMEEDVEAPTLQSFADRAQTQTDGLYLYSAQFSGVKPEELNRLVARMRALNNPSKFTTLSSITPAGAAPTLPEGSLDRYYFVSGDIIQLYLGRYHGEGATIVSGWTIAENFASESLAVGDSFETFIAMSSGDAATHEDIMITITKEAVLREAD